MKILFITPSNMFSGAERVSLDIAKILNASGFNTAYASPKGKIENYVAEYGVKFCPMESFSVKNVQQVCNSFKPDIVHCIDFRASLYVSFTKYKFVSHLHNNPLWLKSINKNSLSMLYFASKAQKIITVSASVMQEYIFGNKFLHKTKIIDNIVDTDSVVLQSQTPCDKCYDIAFIGRITQQKNPLKLVEIVAEIKKQKQDITCVMIGDGELKDDVLAKIKELDLEKNITLAGFLKNPFAQIKNVKVVIMPSQWEGFGLTAVESMALGKPVLASAVGGLKDIVNEKCGSHCNAVQEYAQQALLLLNNDELYSDKAKNAIENSKKFADKEKYYNTIISIYKEISI